MSSKITTHHKLTSKMLANHPLGLISKLYEVSLSSSSIISSPTPSSMTPSPTPSVSTPLPAPSSMTPSPTPSAMTPSPTPSAMTPLPASSAMTPSPTPSSVDAEEKGVRDLNIPKKRGWSGFVFDDLKGIAINRLRLIEECFSGRDIRLQFSPWGELIGGKDRHLNLYPAGQRLRSTSPAQEAMRKHGPMVFFERWMDWVVDELIQSFQEMQNTDSSKKTPPESNVYFALRKASLRVVARTVCASFRGDVIDGIAEALEELDVAFGRLLHCGKGSRPVWFPGSEKKRAPQALKTLQDLIRPLIRQRIGGVVEEDDLLSLWVKTQGEDGRHLNELQVIAEAISFLSMAYTSLPKILYGAVCGVIPSRQSMLLTRLQREFSGIIQALTPAPEGIDLRTPIPSTPNKDLAWRSIPFHYAVTLESMRLYPPAWSINYQVQGEGVLGKWMLNNQEQLWFSPCALHRNERRFKDPNRFWSQRWAGQLEARLPKYAFSPFGFEGKRTLSEEFCHELAPRFLMVWFNQFEVINPPEQLSWSLSICLRPSDVVLWKKRSK